MMTWWDKIGTVVVMVAVMEGIAWAAHRYIMHGWGWGWHRSHHEPATGRFERNDLYAVSFSVLVLVMFAIGLRWEPLWWAALGITAYGAIYAFVHDMLVHQRGGFRWSPRRGYFKRLLQAHRLHHAVEGRDGTVSHGFLIAPSPLRLKAQLDAARRLKGARLRSGAGHRAPAGAGELRS